MPLNHTIIPSIAIKQLIATLPETVLQLKYLIILK